MFLQNINYIFGTYKVPKNIISVAIQNNLTIDTATGYNNAELIGSVIKELNKNASIITKFNLPSGGSPSGGSPSDDRVKRSRAQRSRAQRS